MTLIDRYLPRYQFHEHHSRPLAATPARAMAAVQAYRPEQDRSFAARSPRELPVRAFNQLARGRPRRVRRSAWTTSRCSNATATGNWRMA